MKSASCRRLPVGPAKKGLQIATRQKMNSPRQSSRSIVAPDDRQGLPGEQISGSCPAEPYGLCRAMALSSDSAEVVADDRACHRSPTAIFSIFSTHTVFTWRFSALGNGGARLFPCWAWGRTNINKTTISAGQGLRDNQVRDSGQCPVRQNRATIAVAVMGHFPCGRSGSGPTRVS